MSTPSRKVIVTCDSPNFDSERNSTMSGRPAISLSMGKVTSFSTSSGASAGTPVLICTCGFVMSGTASMGNRSAAHPPTPMRISVASSTAARCRMTVSMRRCSIGKC